MHVGSFDAGRAHGVGIFHAASGAVFKGTWRQNRRVGAFEAVDPKGVRWCDLYDESGKRVRRVRASAKEAAEAAAAEAVAEAEAA